MDKKTKLLFGIFLLIFIIVLGEIIFLFIKRSRQIVTTALPIQQATTLVPKVAQGGGLSISNLPSGYFLVSNNKSSLLLLARLIKISSTSKGIQATLAFSSSNGEGAPIQQNILLVENNTSLIFTQQNTDSLFPSSINTKNFILHFPDIIKTINPYMGKNIIVQFILVSGVPESVKNSFSVCNESFATYLEGGQKPTCLPIAQSVQAYANF